MAVLVVSYSRSGNSSYLAGRLAEALGADHETIRPRLNLFFFQVLFSLMKRGAGIRPLAHDPAGYEAVILVGPIWMGQLLYPLRAFLRTYRAVLRQLSFAVCCGGGEASKDDKFGYEGVFRQVRAIAGDACRRCEAFPMILLLPEGLRENSDAVMKVRLDDQSFAGAFRERFDRFVAVEKTSQQE